MVFGLMPAFSNSSIFASWLTPRMQFVMRAHAFFEAETPNSVMSSSCVMPKYLLKRLRTSSRSPRSRSRSSHSMLSAFMLSRSP